MQPPFIPGLQLAEKLHQVAAPILAKNFPGLAYSAGRLDYGSDVLGFDTERSMDHDWGPRLSLFIAEKDFELKDRISLALGMELPAEIEGHSTHYGRHADNTLAPEAAGPRPINHAVMVTTPGRFLKEYVGLGHEGPPGIKDWLLLPAQRLRAIASGRVFHDGLGALEAMRARLAWYPRDLWLHLMACQWQRINQEEPFMARCGHLGDELGSRLIAARLCAEIMRLGFLMERQHAPYSKWFGTAYGRLEAAAEMKPLLDAVLAAAGYQEREACLGRAYLALMRRHNALGLTALVEERLAPFWSRPYLVPGSGRLVEALRSAIKDGEVLGLPPHLGSLDQLSDCTDLLTRPALFPRLKALHQD